MNRSARVTLSEETLKIIAAGVYRNDGNELVSIRDQTDRAIAGTVLFKTEDFPDDLRPTRTDATTIFEVTEETTLEAAARVTGHGAAALILNFASAKNPGGGFLSGSQAQEESLARSSSLYPCLTAKFEMYEFNRAGSSSLYSHWMIHSPDVPVFRGDDGALLNQPYLVSFITSPAVNAGAVMRNEPENAELIAPTNRERARRLLWLAERYGHRTLILGAWGCGVFGNDAHAIASMFYDLLHAEFAGSFDHVIMAIYDRTPDRDVLHAFKVRFA